MNFILTRASISLLFISLQINEQLRVFECATDFVRVLRKKKKNIYRKVSNSYTFDRDRWKFVTKLRRIDNSFLVRLIGRADKDPFLLLLLLQFRIHVSR